MSHLACFVFGKEIQIGIGFNKAFNDFEELFFGHVIRITHF